MTDVKTARSPHPTETELSDYLGHLISGKARTGIEEHIASCPECLASVVSAYESVKMFKKENTGRKGKGGFMKNFNIYLILAALSFLLSFIIPQYFAQLLVATTLLGIKWISDSKSAKMLVMIYDAWKNGGEKEASRMISRLDPSQKARF